MAERLSLDNLQVSVDYNGYQGSEALQMHGYQGLNSIFPIRMRYTNKGEGIKMFEDNPAKSVHLVTPEDYQKIMEELSNA